MLDIKRYYAVMRLRFAIGALAIALAGCTHADDWKTLDHDGDYYRADAAGPSTWQSAGARRTVCKWERSTAVPATIASTVAAGRAGPNETVQVTMQPGEYFTFNGCSPWHHIG